MTTAPPSVPRPVVPVWLDRLTAIGWRVLAVSALGIVIVAIALAVVVWRVIIIVEGGA